ncbi:MAG: aminomethyltransferase beta-barrel domain-containing protein, partial [Candidatus Paceibacterota bacterium]
HGFTVTKKGTSDAPYFVMAKDILANTLTVSHKEKGSLKGKGERLLTLENVNWTAGTSPDPEKTYSARVRYRGELFPCKILATNNETKVEFLDEQEPVAPGQSVVVYDGEECLGGGILQG